LLILAVLHEFIDSSQVSGRGDLTDNGIFAFGV